jgi:xanthine dehydrogenase accessory factor
MKMSERAQQLVRTRTPFVHATVVRAQQPTSAHAGDQAILLPDGTIEGFLGGQCAQNSVRKAALGALQSNESVLLRVLPDGDLHFPEAPGASVVVNPCLSGGALEIFLEPLLPAPRVRIAGASLIAAALRSLAPELGLDVASVTADAGPRAGDLALVVAAHGRDELSALRAGAEARLPYVGLVASPKRGDAVIEELRAEGVADDLLEGIETPAGLDIGARTPSEIALSILARIVEVRRGHGASAPASAEAPSEALTAVDPICGMTVIVDADTPRVEHDGETVYFCCAGCKTKFEKEHLHVAAAN